MLTGQVAAAARQAIWSVRAARRLLSALARPVPPVVVSVLTVSHAGLGYGEAACRSPQNAHSEPADGHAGTGIPQVIRT
jgi:hypothetical protein